MPTISPSLTPTVYGEDRFPDNWGATVALPVAHIHAAFHAVAAAKADIMDDTTMTEDARLLMIDKLFAEKVERRIPDAQAALEKAREMPAFWREQINDIFAPDSEPAAIAMASEIRGVLRGLSPDERSEVLSNAINNGDLTILKAATYGPEFLHGVSPERVEAVRASYVAKHKPEYADRLKQAERFQRMANGSLGALRQIRSAFFSKCDEQRIADARAKAAKSARHLQ